MMSLNYLPKWRSITLIGVRDIPCLIKLPLNKIQIAAYQRDNYLKLFAEANRQMGLAALRCARPPEVLAVSGGEAEAKPHHGFQY